ncbi:MAG: LCP family protein [Actinomycetota bacterium]
MSEVGSSGATPSGQGHGRLARIAVALTATLSLLIGVGSAYGFIAYKQAGDVPRIDLTPDGEGVQGEGEEAPVGPCIDDVCNYLLLGSDSRAGLTDEEVTQFGSDRQIGGENRADTIMLVHTDPGLEKAIILSFPRDLWVEIPGRGEDKINAAFEGGVDGGGPALVAATLHKLTGLKINHVLYVDLAGFQGVIETLGGVDMCISGENVNTPGSVDGPDGSVFYGERGYIADPYTGLLVKPGCQRLQGDQALAYVRTRHLRCDQFAPDFYRIARQQQFLRAVINRLLEPDRLAQLPVMIKPIMQNLRPDEDLDLADLAFLVGQLEGISSGAAEFRTVPAYPDPANLAILRMDGSAERVFAAIRDGKPLGEIGRDLVYTPVSEANVPVLVVDHASGGTVTGVQDVLSQAGFDISPSLTTYEQYAKKVSGSVIAYAPDADAEAQVVKKYFPTLELQQVKGLPDDVAIFVDGSYEAAEVGVGGPPAECPSAEV